MSFSWNHYLPPSFRSHVHPFLLSNCPKRKCALTLFKDSTCAFSKPVWSYRSSFVSPKLFIGSSSLTLKYVLSAGLRIISPATLFHLGTTLFHPFTSLPNFSIVLFILFTFYFSFLTYTVTKIGLSFPPLCWNSLGVTRHLLNNRANGLSCYSSWLLFGFWHYWLFCLEFFFFG